LFAGLLTLALVNVVPLSADASEDSSVTRTKKVSRTFEIDGERVTVSENTVKVTVDHTKNLRGRERVQINWSGARPSGGRASSPFGERAMAQEYPVVILQCRGVDDESLPAAERLSQQTCWTSTSQQRFRSSSERLAIWRRDPYAAAAERTQKSGIDPFPTSGCDDAPSFSARAIGFIAASGKVFNSCSSDSMAPEAAVDAALPPAEQAAFTGTDGTGSTSFEVRTATENGSLGCSDQVACSIVVIPIEGVSCSEGDSVCQQSGRFAPGSSNFASEGVDAAVSPVYWWTESNWRNRISIPVSFGTAPNVCDVLDSRAPTAFYGSELISQAALQWAPAYCLNKKRFKFQHNRMSDEAAFTLMEKGEAPAALVSGRREQDLAQPVAFAPTAITSFAVTYVIDRPENAGEYEGLRLTPRLLAKLLTQSYTGSSYGAQHPGMGDNPRSINQDPEFRALNPGLDTIDREAAASLLSLSESSDVITSLTSYIANDAEASAFIAGKADKWGMVVNPSYAKLKLPVAEWPLLDTFVPKYELECQQQIKTPYFTQLAAPVSSLRTIAEAVLDGWPNVQTKCDRASSSDPYRFGRTDRQGVGARFLIGIASLGDAERLGLKTAGLRTSSNTWVVPTEKSMAAAISTSKPSASVPGLFEMTAKGLAKSPAAYPGTMIISTAARTSGVEPATAAKVAQFIKISTSEGQRRGSSNGTLPDGFLPIVNSGATKPLYAAAQKSAVLIAAQKGVPAQSALPGSGDTSTPSMQVITPADPDSQIQAGAKPGVTMVATQPTAANTSRIGRLTLPMLLVLCFTTAAAAPLLRRFARLRAAH